MLTPNLNPLPEPDRTLRLNRYLTAIHQEPSLHHLRALLDNPADRQLVLIAALERAVLIGSPAAVPPKPDDHADHLLCDILDVLDGPEFARHGAAYGPDRHLSTLQALGCWRGREPLTKPSAHELFTTLFAVVTASHETPSPASNANLSPRLQDSRPSGELIVRASLSAGPTSPPDSATQVSIIPELVPDDRALSVRQSPASGHQISHHLAAAPGEQFDDSSDSNLLAPDSCPLAPEIIPARPVRRGRPPLLDDLAKGRLLGLIAYGLSFRQAAAQLGIHHATILNLMKRDEQFAHQVAEARLDAISQPLITVIRASRTSWRAAAWLAKFLEDRHTRHIESTPEERKLTTPAE